MLTLLDLVVVALVALSAVRGWRLGLSGFAGGLAGTVLGALAGLWAAGHLVPGEASAVGGLLLRAGCVLAGALLGSAAGARAGERAARLVGAARLRGPDRAAGAVVRGGLGLLACWCVGLLVSTAGVPAATDAVSRSVVLTRVSSALPTAAGLADDLAGRLAVPADLTALVPAAGSGGLGQEELDAAVAASAGSVVLVEGAACGRGVDGSGFAVDGGLVVTNAHVVAGTTDLRVTDAGGAHRATAVVVDTTEDLAVLRVDDLEAPALPLAAEPAANGAGAVVLGHPGGGPLTAVPATVVQRLPVLQPGVAGGSSAREVYRLEAVVRPGNSGGPLVDATGTVIGVVQARSLTSATTGFALTLDALPADLAAAAAADGAADTGACAAA